MPQGLEGDTRGRPAKHKSSIGSSREAVSPSGSKSSQGTLQAPEDQVSANGLKPLEPFRLTLSWTVSPLLSSDSSRTLRHKLSLSTFSTRRTPTP